MGCAPSTSPSRARNDRDLQCEFSATLDVVEPMGMETMVFFTVDGTEVCGRVEPDERDRPRPADAAPRQPRPHAPDRSRHQSRALGRPFTIAFRRPVRGRAARKRLSTAPRKERITNDQDARPQDLHRIGHRRDRGLRRRHVPPLRRRRRQGDRHRPPQGPARRLEKGTRRQLPHRRPRRHRQEGGRCAGGESSRRFRQGECRGGECRPRARPRARAKSQYERLGADDRHQHQRLALYRARVPARHGRARRGARDFARLRRERLTPIPAATSMARPKPS